MTSFKYSKKYVCEKCGYLGDTSEHEGCDYLAWVRNDWASAGDSLSVQAAEYLISALDDRADELEKTNG